MTIHSTHCGGIHNMATPSDEIMEEHSSSSAQSAQPLTTGQKERAMQVMLERLSASSAHFAHQQRDTPDLTQQEKVDIAAEILQKNPARFLARFGKFLHVSDLVFFQDVDKDDYETNFYLKQIQHRCSHAEVIVKNRRFSAMKELDEGGVYFSEDEMKRREPLLYEQMIGQFMTEEEQQQKAMDAIDRSDLRFSTVLMTHMEDAQERELYRFQKENEECQEEEEEEEEDSDDEEDDEDAEHRRQKQDSKTGMEEDDDEVTEDIPEISDVRATGIWQQQLREEFRAIMHEKFLSGDDLNFDYSKVDDNPDYDSLTTVEQDEEQKYFLSEVPHTVEQDSGDNDSWKSVPAKMDQTEEEEEEDYMMYEPPPELVARSAQFVKTGNWMENEDCAE